MSRYSWTSTSATPTATADTTNLVDSTYSGILQGGSGTQQIKINEVEVTGEATASNVSIIKLARDSTVAVTLTAGAVRNALLDGTAGAAAAVPVFGNAATTKPQRSATLHLLNLGMNAFGGINRWQARQGEEITTIGNTASLGEVSLTGYTGTGGSGPMSAHILYEAL